jgi:hypothetical protein
MTQAATKRDLMFESSSGWTATRILEHAPRELNRKDEGRCIGALPAASRITPAGPRPGR